MLKVMCYVFHRSVFVSRIDVSFPAFMTILMHRLRSSFVSVCIEFLSPPKINIEFDEKLKSPAGIETCPKIYNSES